MSKQLVPFESSHCLLGLELAQRRVPRSGPPARRRRVLGLVLAVSCWVAASSRADFNPYTEVIVNRNIFSLKDPPPPPPPPDTTPPAPKITLVGIANVFGKRKAVLKPQPAPGTAPKPAAPGAPPPGQEPPLVIAEGDTLEGIQVVSIDEVSGTVNVNNNGQPLSLTFEKDGMKVPTGPAAPVAGVPGQPGIPGQLPIARPPGLPGVANISGMAPVQLGGLPVTAAGANAGGAFAGQLSAQATTAVAPADGLTQSGLPQRQVRTPSFEEQMLMVEANRMANQDKIDRGLMPPLPPTALTPPEIRSRIQSPLPPNYTPPLPTPQ